MLAQAVEQMLSHWPESVQGVNPGAGQELEPAMLEHHGLTLRPETVPLRGPDPDEQLSRQLRA